MSKEKNKVERTLVTEAESLENVPVEPIEEEMGADVTVAEDENEAIPEVPEIKSFTGKVVNCGLLNLREKPSLDSKILGTLNKGKIETFTATDDPNWLKFNYAFVSSKFIEKV